MDVAVFRPFEIVWHIVIGEEIPSRLATRASAGFSARPLHKRFLQRAGEARVFAGSYASWVLAYFPESAVRWSIHTNCETCCRLPIFVMHLEYQAAGPQIADAAPCDSAIADETHVEPVICDKNCAFAAIRFRVAIYNPPSSGNARYRCARAEAAKNTSADQWDLWIALPELHAITILQTSECPVLTGRRLAFVSVTALVESPIRRDLPLCCLTAVEHKARHAQLWILSAGSMSAAATDGWSSLVCGRSRTAHVRRARLLLRGRKHGVLVEGGFVAMPASPRFSNKMPKTETSSHTARFHLETRKQCGFGTFAQMRDAYIGLHARLQGSPGVRALFHAHFLRRMTHATRIMDPSTDCSAGSVHMRAHLQNRQRCWHHFRAVCRLVH